METVEDVLAHFGVKGMHWGVRRPRGPGGTVSETHTSSPDAARAKEYHTRAMSGGTHTLSNQELQHLVSRLNLEQQYTRLTSGKSGKDKIATGQEAARKILGAVKTVQEIHRVSQDVKKVVKDKKK